MLLGSTRSIFLAEGVTVGDIHNYNTWWIVRVYYVGYTNYEQVSQATAIETTGQPRTVVTLRPKIESYKPVCYAIIRTFLHEVFGTLLLSLYIVIFCACIVVVLYIVLISLHLEQKVTTEPIKNNKKLFFIGSVVSSIGIIVCAQ